MPIIDYPPPKYISDEDDARFLRSHFGTSITDEQIFENIYGGRPLEKLYRSIDFENVDAANLTATIRLTESPKSLTDLVVESVSLRQFLVAGKHLRNWYKSVDPSKWINDDNIWEDGENHWDDFEDSQYQLELCHSEVRRWSIFFRRGGDDLGGAVIRADSSITQIELINNCTLENAFEFRIIYNGSTYHGSFGRLSGDAYEKLSRYQAGSVGEQFLPFADGIHSFGFGPGTIYTDFYEWGPENTDLSADDTLTISLDRYRSIDDSASSASVPFQIELGEIDYQRWGQQSEYYQKPIVRRLFFGYVSGDGVFSKTPPLTYASIRDAREVILPNFGTDGVYNLTKKGLLSKRGYSWLYDFDSCTIRTLESGKHEVEFLRSNYPTEFQLRRLVFGNIDLHYAGSDSEVPQYPRSLTIHRIGYDPRPTTLNYDPDFRPNVAPDAAGRYAFLLAGSIISGSSSYVTPESFGVERLILSRDYCDPSILVVDAISFERILPVWQVRVKLPSTLNNM
ncbi:hypothetical protein [Acaryochloris sp. IP29b_bin.137]|uniref:hypothetical protein n=1 Tax=Acaryochloris sp. IP29b_bin.137 TaxID=2969217 RepID=UPI00261C6A9A|nr:hypothetical protein [Acaryochloris sp. IP29b_bin.137]